MAVSPHEYVELSATCRKQLWCLYQGEELNKSAEGVDDLQELVTRGWVLTGGGRPGDGGYRLASRAEAFLWVQVRPGHTVQDSVDAIRAVADAIRAGNEAEAKQREREAEEERSRNTVRIMCHHMTSDHIMGLLDYARSDFGRSWTEIKIKALELRL